MAVTFSLVSVAQDGTAEAVTRNLPTNRVLGIRPASASEIVQFPTALTAVEMEVIRGNSRRAIQYLSSTATATVVTAVNA